MGVGHTLKDVQKHVRTSREKNPARSHKWLEKLMEDTSCPFVNCDFMGRNLEEIFLHMLEMHKWHWKLGESYPYTSEIMPINVLQSTPQGRKPTFKVGVPSNFGHNSLLDSGTFAHVPFFAAEDKDSNLAPAPSQLCKTGNPGPDLDACHGYLPSNSRVGEYPAKLPVSDPSSRATVPSESRPSARVQTMKSVSD